MHLTDEEKSAILRLALNEAQQAALAADHYRNLPEQAATSEEWHDRASLIWQLQQEARIWRSIAQKMRAITTPAA